MQKITPCLWFDSQAEEAANFYVSVFKTGKIGAISHYGESAPAKKGEVLTVEFELAGQRYLGLNGGPQFKFTEAVSLTVDCADQAEVDYFWDRLIEGGGSHGPCGWLKDRYGLSWQVVPTKLMELITDPATGDRVMAAVMQMGKLDIAKLEAAAKG
jgi:predicted 3-demethylubiquinone-9 3-methyltransferase (glyoxalase superfamily)